MSCFCVRVIFVKISNLYVVFSFFGFLDYEEFYGYTLLDLVVSPNANRMMRIPKTNELIIDMKCFHQILAQLQYIYIHIYIILLLCILALDIIFHQADFGKTRSPGWDHHDLAEYPFWMCLWIIIFSMLFWVCKHKICYKYNWNHQIGISLGGSWECDSFKR